MSRHRQHRRGQCRSPHRCIAVGRCVLRPSVPDAQSSGVQWGGWCLCRVRCRYVSCLACARPRWQHGIARTARCADRHETGTGEKADGEERVEEKGQVTVRIDAHAHMPGTGGVDRSGCSWSTNHSACTAPVHTRYPHIPAHITAHSQHQSTEQAHAHISVISCDIWCTTDHARHLDRPAARLQQDDTPPIPTRPTPTHASLLPSHPVVSSPALPLPPCCLPPIPVLCPVCAVVEWVGMRAIVLQWPIWPSERSISPPTRVQHTMHTHSILSRPTLHAGMQEAAATQRSASANRKPLLTMAVR